VSFCKSCKARIDWYTVAATGKRMPIDPDPAPDGNVRVDVVANTVEVVAPGSRRPLYRSHFATCPAAGQPRRPR
jgi:hypothetical protein